MSTIWVAHLAKFNAILDNDDEELGFSVIYGLKNQNWHSA